MMQREREERLEGKMMFWGKVNGNENDYLVCYALATPALEEGDFPLKKVTLPQRKNPNKHGQKPIRLLCRGPCAAKRRCLVGCECTLYKHRCSAQNDRNV